jgi:ubiquinone/menaquinone biosynthesis C-methylase UbiE
MGATVTGVDFSDVAIDKASELAKQTNADARFICTDIYNLPNVLDEQFDIVFTSYGTIGWLPDMEQWARVVARFMKPNAKFIIVDFHPVLWMFDNDFSHIQYSYFNTEAIVETLSGTYADRDAPLQEVEIGWNHSLTEILSALLANGLSLLHFGEYDYSPFNCFRHTEEFEAGKFRIQHLENKIPIVYSIVMNK